MEIPNAFTATPWPETEVTLEVGMLSPLSLILLEVEYRVNKT